MPNTPTAKAELRKSAKRNLRNRSRRSAMRTAIKKTLQAIEEKNLAAAEASFRVAAQLIDKNVKWNQMHANTAARRKSRLALSVKRLQPA